MKASHLFCQVYHDLALLSNRHAEMHGKTAALALVASAQGRKPNTMQRLLGYVILGLVALLVCVVLLGAMHPTSAATMGRLATPTTHPVQQGSTIQQEPPAAASTFSVLSQPRLSPAFINNVLAAYNSPAAGKGQALYDLGRQYGINSDIALAFFGHESTFGTRGVAVSSRSLGNLRCLPNYACVGGYAYFPTWEEGFKAWYALIRDLYVNTWGLTTIDQILPRYAPPSDHNDDSAYLADLKLFLTTWYEGKVRP